MRYIYGPDGRVVEDVTTVGATDTARWYHHDQLGSTRMLTDVNGNAIGTFGYTPHGALVGSTGTATTNIAWAGEYQDPETGFTYLRARYYDPFTGQFTTRDPIVSATRDAYGYAGNDPVNAVDPFGLNKCEFGANPLRWAGNAVACIDKAVDEGVEFVNKHTQTVGVCVQLNVGFGTYFSGQGCVAIDRNLDVTAIGSVDAGTGTPTVSGGAGFIFSNARHGRDLNGRFSVGGGSVGAGPSVGLDVARSRDCTGRNMTSFYPSIGGSLIPGAEGHGGIGRSAVLGTGGSSCPPRSAKPQC